MVGLIITKVSDGTIKIYIPSMGVTTYAEDMISVDEAVLETVLSIQIQKLRYPI